MTNATISKFGYPESLIGETEYWVCLLRPKQVTLGCAVLACKEDATSLGAISIEASADLATASEKLERAISSAFDPEKFNYLALMMVDPHVHFHVIPRYAETKEFGSVLIPDGGWPKLPDMKAVADLSDETMGNILTKIRSGWR